MPAKNARQLGLRLDETDTLRLEKFEMETHIEGVSLARASLRAALELYEKQGSLRLPLRVVEEPPQDDPFPATTRRSVKYERRPERIHGVNEESSEPPKDAASDLSSKLDKHRE